MFKKKKDKEEKEDKKKPSKKADLVKPSGSFMKKFGLMK